MNIVFENYITDCPGYTGRIEVTLTDGCVHAAYPDSSEPYTAVADCPLACAAREVAPASETDRAAVWNLLPNEARGYYGEACGLNLRRIKRLTFEDGASGYLMVAGAETIFELMKGDRWMLVEAEDEALASECAARF